MSLSKKTCVPCQGGVPPLSELEYTPLLKQLHEDWKVIESHHLKRTFSFPNFVSALSFTNKVGEIAELEGHHPDIYLSWGVVSITIYTHKIEGLTESDFILASKYDTIER